MKKNLILVSILLITALANGQESFRIVNITSSGIFKFSKNEVSGFSLANETIFEFNKFINPGVRIAFQSGKNFNENGFNYLMYSNSISFDAYANVVSYKKHKLWCSGGVSFLHIFFNNVLHSYSGINPRRNIYDSATIGYNKLGVNWLVGYKFDISDSWFVGLETSQLYSKYHMKISGFNISAGFKLYSK